MTNGRTVFLKFCIKLTLLLCACLIGFAILEFTLRYQIHKSESQGQIKHMTDLGFALFDPNIDGHYYSSESNSFPHIITNKDGFIGASYDYKKTPGMERIAIVGDSFVVSRHLDVEENFVSIAEKEYNKKGKRAEFMNFGVSGIGTFQEFKLYQKYVKPYNPDKVVLVMYFGNDFSDNFAYLNPEQSVKEATTTVRDTSRIKEALLQLETIKFVLNIVRNSTGLTMFFSRIGLIHNLGQSTIALDPALGEMITYTDPANPRAIEIASTTVKELQEFKKTVESNGATFMIVLIPSHWQVDNSFSSQLLKLSPQADPYLPQKYIQEGMQKDMQKGITEKTPILDLAPTLGEKINKEKETMFVSSKGHFTKLASEIVGKEVANFIDDQGKSSIIKQ